MSSPVSDDGILFFITALTVLLAASLVEVVRQPLQIDAPPAEDAGGFPGEPEPAWPPPAHPMPSYGRHAAPAEDVTGPRPVRAPGQSPRVAPAAGSAAYGPDAAAPPGTFGGPPWEPAPRPPGLGRYTRAAWPTPPDPPPPR